MMVRCGACRTEFDAPGDGRHACPTCGAMNQVKSALPDSDQTLSPPASDPPPADPPPGAPDPMAPGLEGVAPEVPGLEGVAPEVPGTQAPALAAPHEVQCSECQFQFFVGDIEVASCPNCDSEVKL